MNRLLTILAASTIFTAVMGTTISAIIYGLLWSGGPVFLFWFIVLDFVVRCVLYGLVEWRGLKLFNLFRR